MAYRFKHGDNSVEAGLRRIALGEIDKAVAEIDNKRQNLDDTVHQVRMHCKKLRGLLCLVRPSFDNYRLENAAYRDAARKLAPVRDAAVMIATYDDLLENYADEIDRAAFAPIRRHLTLRKKMIAPRPRDIADRLAQFRADVLAARKRARHWQLNDTGFDAIAGGLRKTYTRAEKAFAKSGKHPSTAAFHEWRKRVKYHGYHTRLLAPIWPAPMKAHRKAAERLNDLLGNHHDLALFRQAVTDEPDAFGTPKVIEVLSGLVQRRQATIEREAFALGTRLLAEPADALAARWRDYWETWTKAKPASNKALTA
jgi:CHAD domain-containing protein